MLWDSTKKPKTSYPSVTSSFHKDLCFLVENVCTLCVYRHHKVKTQEFKIKIKGRNKYSLQCLKKVLTKEEFPKAGISCEMSAEVQSRNDFRKLSSWHLLQGCMLATVLIKITCLNLQVYI